MASYKKKPKNLVPIWFSSMKAAFCSFPTCAELGHQKERHLCITILISAVKFPPSVRFLFLPSGSIWPSTCNSMKEMSTAWTLKLSSAICSSIYKVTLFSYGTIPPYIGVSWLRNTYKNIQDFWLKSSLAMRQNLIPLNSFGHKLIANFRIHLRKMCDNLKPCSLNLLKGCLNHKSSYGPVSMLLIYPGRVNSYCTYCLCEAQ